MIGVVVVDTVVACALEYYGSVWRGAIIKRWQQNVRKYFLLLVLIILNCTPLKHMHQVRYHNISSSCVSFTTPVIFFTKMYPWPWDWWSFKVCQCHGCDDDDSIPFFPQYLCVSILSTVNLSKPEYLGLKPSSRVLEPTPSLCSKNCKVSLK